MNPGPAIPGRWASPLLLGRFRELRATAPPALALLDFQWEALLLQSGPRRSQCRNQGRRQTEIGAGRQFIAGQGRAAQGGRGAAA